MRQVSRNALHTNADSISQLCTSGIAVAVAWGWAEDGMAWSSRHVGSATIPQRLETQRVSNARRQQPGHAPPARTGARSSVSYALRAPAATAGDLSRRKAGAVQMNVYVHDHDSSAGCCRRLLRHGRIKQFRLSVSVFRMAAPTIPQHCVYVYLRYVSLTAAASSVCRTQ